MQKSLTFAAVLFCFVAAKATATDSISFDARSSFACRDVTPHGFKTTNPGLKIVEVPFKITGSLGSGVKEETIDQILYRIEFPDDIDVADFLPKTEVASDLAGPIEKTDSQTRTQSIQVVGEGTASAQYASLGVSIGAKADKSSSGNAFSAVQVKFLPPKQLVLAAGTQSRGKVLYYKLHPYTQITLEGEREFACLLSVPADWKGECVTLRCSGHFKDITANVAQEMKVGIYLEGDSNARAAVEKEAKEFGIKPVHDTDDKPQSPAEPSATMDQCVGKWVWRTSGRTIDFDLATDGTFTAVNHADDPGWQDIADGKGHWDVTDGFLTITMTHVGRLGLYTPFSVNWIDKDRIERVTDSEIALLDNKPLRKQR
jgi:hypothetical protein